MDTEKIRLKLLLTSLFLVLFVELVAGSVISGTKWPPFVILGTARLVEISLLCAIIQIQSGTMGTVGLKRVDLLPALKTGLVWSAGFAVVAGIGAAGLFAIGMNPTTLIRTPVPNTLSGLLTLFLVGGFISPVAEELLFRGIIYGFFRKWGVLTAIVISTLFFTLMHSAKGIPITQAVGGVVFAVAYETGKSLMVPMVIHILGNCAIFTLSIIFQV